MKNPCATTRAGIARRQRDQLRKLYAARGKGVHRSRNVNRALGTGDAARELKAAQQIIVDDVARDPGVERVPDAGIEDQLGGRARVDAAEHGRCRVLAHRGRALLIAVVSIRHFSGSKVLVPLFHCLERLFGRQPIPLILRQSAASTAGGLRRCGHHARRYTRGDGGGEKRPAITASRHKALFDVPCVGVFEDVVLVQRTDLTADEEILVLLLDRL
jgi:hypothetical protein